MVYYDYIKSIGVFGAFAAALFYALGQSLHSGLDQLLSGSAGRKSLLRVKVKKMGLFTW